MSLTNGSHQVNSRILRSPFFVSCVQDETGWWMFNMHLSNNPPSPWRILFWYGRLPRQFSRLKKFKALVVPVGGWRKEIIIQGEQRPSGLPVIGHSWLKIKEDVMGASFHSPRQRNSMYAHMVRRYIYNTRWPEHPHPPIRQYKQLPKDPLLGPVTGRWQQPDLRSISTTQILFFPVIIIIYGRLWATLIVSNSICIGRRMS